MRISDWSSDVCSSDLSTSNPCSISQAAAVAALNGPQDFLEERNIAFRKRRDMVVAMLNDAPGLACPVPEGAFYVYPDASGVIGKTTPKGLKIATDEDLINYFLDEARVAAVHGAAFGLSPSSEEHTSELQSQLRL